MLHTNCIYTCLWLAAYLVHLGDIIETERGKVALRGRSRSAIGRSDAAVALDSPVDGGAAVVVVVAAAAVVVVATETALADAVAAAVAAAPEL